MANDTQRWAAVQLQRIRRDQGEYEYQRNKLRAQQDADFAQGLASTAQHGGLMAGPGSLGADLGLAALGFVPGGQIPSAIGFGALGAARMAEGFKRRGEGLPGTTSEIGWGALDVGAPFIGKAYRGIKRLLPTKPPPLRPHMPGAKGTVADFRWPAGKPLQGKRTQKGPVEDVNQPLEVSPKSPGMDELVPAELKKKLADQSVAQGPFQPMVAPGRGRYATQGTEGRPHPRPVGGPRPHATTFGPLKHKIDLADPQSWVHLPDEIPGRPNYFGGRPLPIAKGPEGLNIDRPLLGAGRAQNFPFDPALTGAARTAALPERAPRGLKQWEEVHEPLTSAERIPSRAHRGPSGDLTKMGPAGPARQQMGGGEVAIGAARAADEVAAAAKFGDIDDAYTAVVRLGQGGLQPGGRFAGPSTELAQAKNHLNDLLHQKYELVAIPQRTDEKGMRRRAEHYWAERGSTTPFRRRLPGEDKFTDDPWEYYELGRGHGERKLGAGIGGGPPRPLAGGLSGGAALNNMDDLGAALDNIADDLSGQGGRPPGVSPTVETAVPPNVPPRVARGFQAELDRLQAQKEVLVNDIRQTDARDFAALTRQKGDPLPTPALTQRGPGFKEGTMDLHIKEIARLERRQEVLRQRLQGIAAVPPDPTDYARMSKSLTRLLTERKGLSPHLEQDYHARLYENNQDIQEVVSRIQAHPQGANFPNTEEELIADYFIKAQTRLPATAQLRRTRLKTVMAQAQPEGQLLLPLPASMGDAAARLGDKGVKDAFAAAHKYCAIPSRGAAAIQGSLF